MAELYQPAADADSVLLSESAEICPYLSGARGCPWEKQRPSVARNPSTRARTG
jgi:hypothetical protein